jgi:hypothetical protein
MKINLNLVFFQLCILMESFSAIIPVGANHPYEVLNEVFMIVVPRDSIIFLYLIIQSGMSVSNLEGTSL